MSQKNLLISILIIVGIMVAVARWPSKKQETPLLLPEPCSVSIESTVEPIVQEITMPVVDELIASTGIASTSSDADLPKEVDLTAQLFQPNSSLLPIVETVSYVSRVPWLTSRSAYLGDWSVYFETSKHFISRSMKGKGNYLHEQVSRGDRFNVFRKDRPIEFHLVVDLSRTKLWLYYFDKKENQRQLVKSYRVCLGQLSADRHSGSLTPLGVFEVGKETAIYKEGDMGLYKNEPCEMVTVFGQRWIPLSREIANCSGSCKGLGLHGVPWVRDPTTGQLVEKSESIGGYGSLGSIRLLTEDIQEIFAIITSKPSYVHIVKDFQDAKLPGEEKAANT